MDTTDYRAIVAAESARFGDVLAHMALDARVHSCPDWTAADLAWHLAEVQHFWSAIVAGLLHDPDLVPKLVRPDDTDLRDLQRHQATALLEAFQRRTPGDTCWSWADDGGTVGWVLRRQAHEVIVHRVDAELAAGVEVTDTAPHVAADTVDELVTVMVDGVPDWGTFTPDGSTLDLHATDVGRRWRLRFGRFTGTSPNSGSTYDLDAAGLSIVDANPADVEIAGRAWLLARWGWGRGDLAALSVTGDSTLPERLRAVIAEGTQ